MNSEVIHPDAYLHPLEKAAAARIVGLSKMIAWVENTLGGGMDSVNRYVCSSSALRIPEDHPVRRMAEDAAKRFGLKDLPELYLTRAFSYEIRLGGYEFPTLTFPSVLLEQADRDILRCRLSAVMAGIRAGHHRMEYLLWLTENMAGSVPVPFAGQSVCTLLYQWNRAMVYSRDRAAYLGTGSLESSLRNILFGVVPAKTLQRFRFGEEGTFAVQVERYQGGLLEKTLGALGSIMQDYAWLPERYRLLVEFAKGGAGNEN